MINKVNMNWRLLQKVDREILQWIMYIAVLVVFILGLTLYVWTKIA